MTLFLGYVVTVQKKEWHEMVNEFEIQ